MSVCLYVCFSELRQYFDQYFLCVPYKPYCVHSRINSLPTPGSGVVGLGVTVSAVATRLPWRRWQRSASYPIAAIVACDIVDKRAQSDRQVSPSL